MPTWLRDRLAESGKVTISNNIAVAANETCNILPVFARLCEQDQDLEQAFLCHPGVKHVAKMPDEGVFTGYQNIQMLISYMQAAHLQGFEHFHGRQPTILRLQDLIEEAWDKGINVSGRIETGGIKGTRKWIGTLEVTGPVKLHRNLCTD
jgi:hypothetical protein